MEGCDANRTSSNPQLLINDVRQVAKDAADFVLLAQHVDAVEVDGAAVGILKRGYGTHERTLSSSVRPDQAEHAVADGE